MHTLGSGPVALDTVCFIYWIEEHPRYVSVLTPLFSDVAEGHRTAISSAVSIAGSLKGLFGGGEAKAATPPAFPSLPPAAKPPPSLTDAQRESAASRRRARFRSALAGRDRGVTPSLTDQASTAPKELLGE